MVGSFGWAEILLITATVVIFLGGGKQLPDIAQSLGEAIREFRRSANPDANPKEDPDQDTGSNDTQDDK